MRGGRLIGRCLAIALAVAAATAGEAAEVRVDLRGLAQPAAGELVVSREAGDLLVLPLRDVVEVATPLPATVTCRGEGLWCPEVALGEESVQLPVYAAVEVRARLAGPAAGAGLRFGTVQGVVREESSARPLEFRRELAFERAELHFAAPRAVLDLRFAFAGAAPVYRWSVAPPGPEGEPVLDLGALRLEPGASVSGWLISEETEAPVAKAVVKVRRAAQSDAPDRALGEVEAQSNDRGFFQLHGLDPGTYRLQVDAEGFATTVLDVVELPEAAERLLGTLALSPPITLSVQVDPPFHPGGSAWRLSIRPVHPRPDEAGQETTVDPSGVGRIDVDRAGPHYIQLLGPDQDLVHFETRELARNEWLPIDVPIVLVEGEVRLGGEPLAARVRLQGGAGDRADLESDEDGALAGWMRVPERPWLMADVTWHEAGREKTRTVEVVPEVDEDGAEITIDLPAGVITGDVFDPEGVPQAGVRVVATPEEGASMYTEVKTTTDGSGRFHLTGLETGRYLLQAGGNGGPASELAPVDVLGDFPGGGARLVLWPVRRVTLTLTIGGQPALGAAVSLVGFGRTPGSYQATTDAQGRAVFVLPEAVERVVATLFDPSRWLWSGCASIDEGEIRLDLPALQPGTLELEIEARMDLPPILDGNTVLWTGSGGFVTHGVFNNWSRLRGGEQRLERDEERVVEVFRIPGLSPGRYGIGWSGAPEWELAARACAGGVSDAEWTTVPAGGEATLSTDSTERQRRRLRELRDSSRR